MTCSCHRFWFGFCYNGNSKASKHFSWNSSVVLAPPAPATPERSVPAWYLATCGTRFPTAPIKLQQVGCCKQVEQIIQKKQGLWQRFCPAEEADFTMQMVIAAIFKDKLLTSFRQGKNRGKQLIYYFPCKEQCIDNGPL